MIGCKRSEDAERLLCDVSQEEGIAILSLLGYTVRFIHDHPEASCVARFRDDMWNAYGFSPTYRRWRFWNDHGWSIIEGSESHEQLHSQ